MEITELIIWSAIIFNFVLSVIIAVGFIRITRLLQELEVKTGVLIKTQEKRLTQIEGLITGKQ